MLKSIIIGNLYGVDLMEEAVEICKLRLFLKLVAQIERKEDIEPLPDIDFNVRSGNTLVGFASLGEVKEALSGDWIKEQSLPQIEERAKAADVAFGKFRRMQVEEEMNVNQFLKAKADLEERLGGLRGELDGYLAKDYGVKTDDKEAVQEWQRSHRPFHWFVEFYGIMRQGGFDVIIGNPPYVEYSKVKKDRKEGYTIKNYTTLPCGNLYAFVLERANSLKSKTAYFGMIVPISITSANRMQSLRDIFESHTTYSVNFADCPVYLFTGAHQILTIVVAVPKTATGVEKYSAGFKHWKSEERDCLMPLLFYQEIPLLHLEVWIKNASPLENAILTKIERNKNSIPSYFQSSGETISICGGTGGYWLRTFDGAVSSGEYKTHSIARENHLAICAVLNSRTFYWFWRKVSNCRHLNTRDMQKFKIDLHQDLLNELDKVGAEHLEALKATREYRPGKMAYDQYRPAQAKAKVDEIDRVLAKHYGFTDEELDFIINYDIKYRMGLGGGTKGNKNG